MIVFDLDDTLYHERDFVRSGRAKISAHMYDDPTFDIDGQWTDDLKEIYRNHMPNISLTADARMTLEYLKSKGIMMAVVTDGRSITQRNKFHALGLDKYIDEGNLYISEEVGADKLSDASFRDIMSKYPEEKSFIYVGDNPVKDFFQPNCLGWTTVMLWDTEGCNIHPQSLDLEKDYLPQKKVNSLYIFFKNHTL